MEYFSLIAGLFFLSTVKFLFAPAACVASGFGFFETFLITVLGGITGVLAFFYAGSFIFSKISAFFPQKKKSAFTKRNKLIIRTKNKFGVIGLAVSMAFISIPLACLLAAKYFRHNPRTVPFLVMSIIGWSLILTTISVFFKNLF